MARWASWSSRISVARGVPLGGGGAGRGAGRRESFQAEADLGDLDQVRQADRGDERAPARQQLDEVVHGQPLERLAHRCPPHAQPRGDVDLAHRRARRQLEEDDLVPERPVDPVPQR
jgi:hypothetical protein